MSRNPHAIYHLMNLAQLDKATPDFSWQDYFTDVGHPELKSINLAMPDVLQGHRACNWRGPRWTTGRPICAGTLADAFAPYLSKPFVDEDFTMQLRAHRRQGTAAPLAARDRHRGRCPGLRHGQALRGEGSSRPPPKQAVLDILHGIRAALKDDLNTLAWMTPETRKAAIKKLDLMGERIGYPDKWRDYSALQIERGPYVLNVMRANEFEQKRELNKIGKPVDKNEWGMTPQTVNAYYDPCMNNINFPAGILQPPFFDPNAPMAVNYGALGFVMGHEMTHGFDDQGSQFDGHGNLKNWWTPADRRSIREGT